MSPFLSVRTNVRQAVPFLAFLLITLTFLSPWALAANQKAVVMEKAADYTGSAHAIIDVNPVGGPRSNQLDLFPQAESDYIIRSYGNYYYLIGRYGTDSLTKFHIDDPENPVYQVSVLIDGQTTSNPHDLVFVNADKAYMTMNYGSVCWIINPNNGKKIGELDLSAYSDQDGKAEPTTCVVVGDKLFINFHRYDRTSSYAPNETFVAVFDVTTDQEIDTGKSGTDGIKGIKIPGRAPRCMQYLPENNTIYIACSGGSPKTMPDLAYTGGVVTINPDTYEATLLVDDGPDGADGDHPYYSMMSSYVIHPTLGFIMGYDWPNAIYHLYKFNPTTGDFIKELTDFEGQRLAGSSETYCALDENGLLWIGIGSVTDHHVLIMNPESEAIDEKINVNLYGASIALCPQTVWPGSNEVASATGTGTIKVVSNQGKVGNLTTSQSSDYPNAAGTPEGKTFKDGLVGFTVDGLTQESVKSAASVTMTMPSALGTSPVYYQINSEGNFEELDTSLITAVDEYTSTLTLTDGGTGDQDGTANGVILHHGGWAAEYTDDQSSEDTGGGDSGGGGGCFLSSLD